MLAKKRVKMTLLILSNMEIEATNHVKQKLGSLFNMLCEDRAKLGAMEVEDKQIITEFQDKELLLNSFCPKVYLKQLINNVSNTVAFLKRFLTLL